MHGHPGEGTSGAAFAGDSVIGELVGMTDYQKGQAYERRTIRRKVGNMLDQVKRLEIHQSSQVTLQELGIWMDERTNGVAKKFALAAAEALQAECIRRNLRM